MPLPACWAPSLEGVALAAHQATQGSARLHGATAELRRDSGLKRKGSSAEALFKIAHIRITNGARVIMQDHAQQGAVDLEVPVIFDEPMRRNLFMKELTRERVVPIISASVSWLILASTG